MYSDEFGDDREAMIKIEKIADDESKRTVPPLFPLWIIVFVLSLHWDSDVRTAAPALHHQRDFGAESDGSSAK